MATLVPASLDVPTSAAGPTRQVSLSAVRERRIVSDVYHVPAKFTADYFYSTGNPLQVSFQSCHVLVIKKTLFKNRLTDLHFSYRGHSSRRALWTDCLLNKNGHAMPVVSFSSFCALLLLPLAL